MKILIVGLGLIGASYAKCLIKKGYQVYGVDKDISVINYALENNIITKGSLDEKDYINEVDLIIIALYPDYILPFLKSNQSLFKENQVITDVAGVKNKFLDEAIKSVNEATYISHHPMAGRETIGITYANENLFIGANCLVCYENEKAKPYLILKKVLNDLGFSKISLVSHQKHDQMIAFTSQLTHIIACSLVNSDKEEDTKDFVGDSYKDLTRIAKINETLWSQLFLANDIFLLKEIEKFEEELTKIKQAILKRDEDELKKLLIKAKEKRSEM